MTQIPWNEALDQIRPHVFKISTPRGFGTGFLLTYAGGGTMCGLATAAHVVEQAFRWEEPVRILHPSTNQSILLRPPERGIFMDASADTAALVFSKGELDLPEQTLPLTPEGMLVKIGHEIGWVGFPAIAPDHLCFFSGRASAWVEEKEGYYVDGVAINGVSGGPAFWSTDDFELYIVGVVSAYRPNMQYGTTLPGLSIVRHVRHLRGIVSDLENLDEAVETQTPPESVEERPQEPESGA